MELAKFRWIVVWVAVLVGCLGFSQSVRAATGTIYFAPAAATVINGSEVSLGLRINPGTQINGVQAVIEYDATKLQMVSFSDTGTAFPEIAEQNSEANPITLTRTTSGNVVSSDALIVTVRFKALVSSGSTTVTVSGNAAQGGVPSNPTAQGATLSFGANTPAPSNPSTPKPQNPTPGGSTTPTTPAEPSANSPTMPSVEGGGINESEVARQAEQRQKSLWQWFWWLAIFPALLLVFLGLWLFRRRQARLKLEASQRPIDRTWAAAPVQQHEDPRTNELLEHAPGVGNPDPGSVVSPGTHKADDKK